MEELQCPICANDYSQSNPPRLLTMCGHTFCHQCIKHLIKRNDFRYDIRCPQDRLSITMDINSPSHFPKNIALLQAIRRKYRQRQDCSYQHNEFLTCSVGSFKKSILDSKSIISDFKQVFIGQRRTSIQEGICLLHRKPLDIVCIQEKSYICAECALFGLHKGHSFTTFKELNNKNKIWSDSINQIVQEKKHIDTKILNGQLQKELSSILNKKKQLLMEEVNCNIKRIQSKIISIQRSIKQDLDHKLSKLEAELKLILAINPHVEEQFNAWTEQVKERCSQLEHDSIDSIVILDESDYNLCKNGDSMLQKIKNELIRFWSTIQSALQYPKVLYSPEAQKNLSNIITIETYEYRHLQIPKCDQMEVTKLDDNSVRQNYRNDNFLNEVSLLDISANGFKFQGASAIDYSQISLINEPFQISTVSNLQKSEIIGNKPLKKAKSRQLNLNISLINSLQKKVSFKSPKQKQKTLIFSKKSINSPITPTPKTRLRKFILKVKEPQKFEKIVSALQADSINSIDLTGFDIGDQGAKQLCIKIAECKRPRLLRLMKNNLTDQSMKEVLDTLKVIDYLNLAQNNFSQKILDLLIQMQKKELIGKGKTIQLGQNRLNSRKIKEKIEQLKKLGVIITL